MTALASIHRLYNDLRDDVYGHFYRSRNTLNLAREDLFAAGFKFPYFRLTDDLRKALMERLRKIIGEDVDPTIEYLQKVSMNEYWNFLSAEENATAVEDAFASAQDQLDELSVTVSSATAACLSKEGISQRKLLSVYNPFTNAINDCTRTASSEYRRPINVFTNVHFKALPLLTQMSFALNDCSNSLESSRDTCTNRWLKNYCDEESCNVSKTM